MFKICKLSERVHCLFLGFGSLFFWFSFEFGISYEPNRQSDILFGGEKSWKLWDSVFS